MSDTCVNCKQPIADDDAYVTFKIGKYIDRYTMLSDELGDTEYAVHRACLPGLPATFPDSLSLGPQVGKPR